MAGIPAALRRYLDAHDLPPALALQPAAELARLDWDGIATHTDIAADEAAGLGLALNFQPSLIMLGLYFERRRPLANGLAAAISRNRVGR